MLGYTWKTRGIVFLVNIIVIAAFFGLGRLADILTGRSPLITFAAVIVSFPVSQLVTMRVLKKRLKKEYPENV